MARRDRLRWLAVAIVVEVAAALVALPFRHFYKDFNGPNGTSVAEVPLPGVYVLVFAVFSIVLWTAVLAVSHRRSKKIMGMK